MSINRTNPQSKGRLIKAASELTVGKNNIKWMNDRMVDLCKAEKLTKVAMPTFQKLGKDMNDTEIESTLKPGFCTLSDVYAFIRNAPEECRDGYANLFYFPAFVVSVRWSSGLGGWSVGAWGRDGYRWYSDNRVFSPATDRSGDQTLPSDTLDLIDFDVKKAAKFSKKEIDWMNTTAERIFDKKGQRPVAYMALCAHIIGCIIHASDGAISKKLIVDLISNGVEF